MMAMAAPRPKSPPASPDPFGRHRLQHAVDTLHREIGFLEGEINSIQGVHTASKCCKEVDEFIGKNNDPFISISSKKGNTDQSYKFLKKFRARACLSYLSWICCCGGCSSSSSSFRLKGPSCCCCCCGCCSSCGSALERLCRCCCGGIGSGSSCRCRGGCEGCGCGGCGSCRGCCTPCPRCSCGCTCSCPSCSCTCPTCSAAFCVPRCCLC